MYSCSPNVNKAIPDEYRKITEALFPPEQCAAGQGIRVEEAAAFADILGIGVDYRHLLEVHRSPKEMDRFLGHFQNNLDLLIQKTWVEKADEDRKEKLQDRIPAFIEVIEEENYQKALEEFGGILEELAYLLFGAQSRKDDFTEYTLRIDTQMGLFWWYGGQIGSLYQSKRCFKPADKESLKALLFIGLCYLTNF
ncbi:MAG: hypothetical protein LBP42_08065 [Treponema sp.]|jgi:hypothetical protein|nr:hypothetical protein [Treponema sp.]